MSRAAVLLFGLAPGLLGFSSATSFDLEADLGGGGGYTFTGSPVSHGMSCAVCHTGGEGTELAVSVYTDPPGLFTVGYVPGTVYQFVVRLGAEQRGLERQGACAAGAAGCNRNLFVAEFLTASGAVAGVVCPDDIAFDATGACTEEAGRRTTLLREGRAVAGQSLTPAKDCADPEAVASDCVDSAAMRAAGRSEAEIAAAFSAASRGSTVWRFQWRAPARAEGGLEVWVALVDGDGGVAPDPRYADTAHDAVVVRRFVAMPYGAAEGVLSPGCGGAAPEALSGGLAAGVVVVGLLAWRRRRRA